MLPTTTSCGFHVGSRPLGPVPYTHHTAPQREHPTGKAGDGEEEAEATADVGGEYEVDPNPAARSWR